MNLGLADDKVLLVAHDKNWNQDFKKEKELLLEFVKSAIDIEHCGSTSIPNIPSKPIMNICISVNSADDVEGLKDQFNSAGYEYKSKDFVDHLLFTKRNEKGESTHHVHVMSKEGTNWKKALGFRDYLLNHKDVAQEYALLKLDLAKKFPCDRRAYAEGKNPFIEKVLSKIL